MTCKRDKHNEDIFNHGECLLCGSTKKKYKKMIEVITKKLENGIFMAECSDKYGMIVYDENEKEAVRRLKHKLKLKKLKEDLNVTKKDIAFFFGMSYGSFANSSAKERYEDALYNFYEHIKAQP